MTAPPRAIASRLLEDPWVPWLLAGIFATCGVLDVATERHLHDEGLLTHLFARMTWEQPVDLVFLQKSRPPIAVLYAPFAASGPRAFAIAHVVVAALAVGLLGSLSRALGHRWPNVAPLVLAASPLYFACAAAGVSNSDGVAVAILGAWLWLARGRPLAGAFVLGMLPWIRAELAPLPLALLLVAQPADRRWAWIGVAIFPLLYAGVGAFVHGDVLWWAHYPPSLPTPMEGHPLWATQDPRITAPALSSTLLALSPAWLLAIPRPGDRGHRVQWAWLAFAAFEIGVLLALPRWRAFNFDLSPRYLLGAIPALALVISARVEGLAAPTSTRTRLFEVAVLVGGATLAFAVAKDGAHPAALAATAILAAAIALGHAGLRAPAAAAVLVLVALGPVGFADGTFLRRDAVAPELDGIRERIAADPQLDRRPIFTNAPLLASALEGHHHGPVHYIVQADQLHEVVALTNPTSGQRARVLEALGRDFYGIPVFADAFTPTQLPDDAVLVLVDDPRLSLVMPAALWDPALRIHSASARFRIAELARKDAQR